MQDRDNAADFQASTTGWQRQRELFEQALDLPQERWSGFVSANAGDQPELADSLQRLLAAHAKHVGHTAEVKEVLVDQASVIASPNQPGQRLGAYQLVEEIGRGGMGVVWKATRQDGQVQQTVAIKLLAPHRWDQQSRARFYAEREALAGLEHPGIARLIDAGEIASADSAPAGSTGASTQPYFAMEYIEGQSITDYAKASKLTTHERVRLFQQVLDAIDYAHRRLLIHRDLKPSNILVTASGQVKIIDFGIAKTLASPGANPSTQTQARFFSPANAAPEQLSGTANTVAVDIYQLGSVLYELIADQSMFDFGNSTPAEIEQAIQNQVPKAPSKYRRQASGIDAELDAICLHSIRKEANQRYASVAAMQEDLFRALSHRPISIRTGQRGYRLRKFIRRHLGAVAAGVVIVSLLSVFALSTVKQNRTIRVERDRAVAEQKNAEAVTDFLVESFTQLDPVEGWTKDATVSDLLDSARVRVLSTLPNSREQFLLMSAVFSAHLGFGKLAEAETLLAKMELQSNIDLQLKPKVLRAKLQLASRSDKKYFERQEIRALIKNLEKSNDIESLILAHFILIEHTPVEYKEVGEDVEKDISKATNFLQRSKSASSFSILTEVSIAKYLLRRKWNELAMTSLKTTLAKIRPEQKLLQGVVLVQMSIAEEQAGRMESAFTLAKEALAVQKQALPESHPQILEATINAAVAAQRFGLMDEAERRFGELIPQLNSIRPIPKSLLALALINQADFYMRKAEPLKAIPIYREAIKNADESIGAAEPRTKFIRAAYASALADIGDCKAALQVKEELAKLGVDIHSYSKDIISRCG
jgi:eukaryotic-like serine/threonine-protein kinase